MSSNSSPGSDDSGDTAPITTGTVPYSPSFSFISSPPRNPPSRLGLVNGSSWSQNRPSHQPEMEIDKRYRHSTSPPLPSPKASPCLVSPSMLSSNLPSESLPVIPLPFYQPIRWWSPLSSPTHPWLSDVLGYVVPTVAAPNRSEIRVLCHALPSPSPSAHVFPLIVSSLQHYPSQPLSWIHVSHVVQSSYHLSDLAVATTASTFHFSDEPTSNLPARVFDVAVPIDSPLPQTPNRTTHHNKDSFSTGIANPAVPPNSIHLTVLERYIPPSSMLECSTLFSSSGPSLLIDRLTELSSDGGIALFVYPTRTGGSTFMKSHLGPALDPILRSLAVVHGFPADLISSVGRMPTIDTLPEFKEMKASIIQMCAHLSADSTKPSTESESDGSEAVSQPHKLPASYEIIVAQKTEISLDSSIWPEQWWAAQEQERIKSLIRAYIPTSGGWQSRTVYTPTAAPHSSEMSCSPGGVSVTGIAHTDPLTPSRSASTSSVMTSHSTASRASVNQNHHRSSLHESTATPTILTHEIINGLVNRVKMRGKSQPSAAGSNVSNRSSFHSDEQIEVGVFIIRKAAVQ